MSLSSIRTRIKNNIENNDLLTDTQIDQFINDTQRRTCRAHNFFWMETSATRSTTNGTSTYTLPSAGDSNWTQSAGVLEYKDEIDFNLTGYDSLTIPLTRTYQREAQDNIDYEDTSATGTPKRYSIQAGYIKLYQAPGHAYNNNTAWTMNLNYYGYLTELSGDSATNALVSEYPELLEYGATAECWRYLFEEDRADYWEGKYAAIYQEAVEESQKYIHGNIEEGMRPADCSIMAHTQKRIRFSEYDL